MGYCVAEVEETRAMLSDTSFFFMQWISTEHFREELTPNLDSSWFIVLGTKGPIFFDFRGGVCEVGIYYC